MEKLLIYIKHNLKFLWQIIDWVNSLLFSLLYSEKMERQVSVVFSEFALSPYSYARLGEADIDMIHRLINSQNTSDLTYFRPHGFDPGSIRSHCRKKSFLMMGAFDGERLVGYFFLRFFTNKKCFVGRLIDKDYRGKGIGQIMNNIMYEIAWRMGFRCLSTISKNNALVMRSHSKNKRMLILKELQNDYMLVEFKRN